MARTLIGQLVIRLKEELTGEKKVVNELNKIEGAANRLGRAPWGVGFQAQLDKLKLTPLQAEAIRRSFLRVPRDINGALDKTHLAAWKTAIVRDFAAVESRARTHARVMQGLMKPLYTSLGFYTMAYGGGLALREGMTSAADRMREQFREDTAGIPADEQAKIGARSAQLSYQYPSVNQTEAMEMARTARNTMGSTDAALELLPTLIQAQVALQSTQGVDVAAGTMQRLIKALDNLGQNVGGEIGLANMQDIIAGAVRAAQIEGYDLDIGQYLQFALRSKTAGPALSTEFLATVAPALMQDMTPTGAGNALAMAFKSLVLGDNSVNGKVYRQRQAELGLRESPDAELVGGREFGEDPYQWVKKYLIPGLEKAGVDLTDDVAVAMAVGKLSGNSNATGILTRMITQQEQIDRNIEMYNQAMGPEAAELAASRDPYVALEALISSFQNFSAAIGEHVMPVIVPGLNALTNVINTLAEAAKNAPNGWAVLGTGAAAAGAGYGLFKGGQWLLRGLLGGTGLEAAGVSLQTAAGMLMEAAAAQGAGGAVGGAAGAGAKGAPGGGVSGAAAGAVAWLKGAAVVGAPGVLADLAIGGPNSVEEYDQQVAEQGDIKRRMWGWIDSLLGTTKSAAAEPQPEPGGSWFPGLAAQLPPDSVAEIAAIRAKLDVIDAQLARNSLDLLGPVDVNRGDPASGFFDLPTVDPAVAAQRAARDNLAARIAALEAGAKAAPVQPVSAAPAALPAAPATPVAPAPGAVVTPHVDTGWSALVEQAAAAAKASLDTLETPVSPQIDSGPVLRLNQQLRESLSLIQQIGKQSMGLKPPAGLPQSSVNPEIRRTFTDYGVSP